MTPVWVRWWCRVRGRDESSVDQTAIAYRTAPGGAVVPWRPIISPRRCCATHCESAWRQASRGAGNGEENGSWGLGGLGESVPEAARMEEMTPKTPCVQYSAELGRRKEQFCSAFDARDCQKKKFPSEVRRQLGLSPSLSCDSTAQASSSHHGQSRYVHEIRVHVDAPHSICCCLLCTYSEWRCYEEYHQPSQWHNGHNIHRRHHQHARERHRHEP